MTFLGPFQLRLFNASVMQSQHRQDTETGPLYLSHHLRFFLFEVGIVDRFCTSSALCSLEATAVHFLRHFQWNTSGCNICGTTNFCAHTLWYRQLWFELICYSQAFFQRQCYFLAIWLTSRWHGLPKLSCLLSSLSFRTPCSGWQACFILSPSA